MKKVTQTRIGSRGNCFAACLASIFETALPEFGLTSNPDYDGNVDRWLARRGYRYQQVATADDSPPPLGYHTIEGISPRGGLHATVGLNGKMVWDPHPKELHDGQGLKTVERYGLLLPLKASAKDSVTLRPDRDGDYTLEYDADPQVTSRFRPGKGYFGGKVGKRDGSLVVYLDGKRIGAAGVLYEAGNWHITTSSVEPRLVGKGYGKYLYAELVRQAAEQGVKELRSCSEANRSPGAEHAWANLAKTHGAVLGENGVWRVKAKDGTTERLNSGTAYRPGDRILLPNGKRATVSKVTPAVDLFGNKELHVSTTTGEVLPVPLGRK